MTCPYCGTSNHPVAECPERLEEHYGTPSDNCDDDVDGEGYDVPDEPGVPAGEGRSVEECAAISRAKRDEVTRRATIQQRDDGDLELVSREIRTDGGWPTGDPCPGCDELMDVGAVGNPGETITWQECKDCQIGWGPFTGFVKTDRESDEREVRTDGGNAQCASDTELPEVGRCQVCNNVDGLERIPLGTTEEGLTGKEPLDAKFCPKCYRRLRRYFETDTDRHSAPGSEVK